VGLPRLLVGGDDEQGLGLPDPLDAREPVEDELLQLLVVGEADLAEDVGVAGDEEDVLDLLKLRDLLGDVVRLGGLDLQGDERDDALVPPDLRERTLDRTADRRLASCRSLHLPCTPAAIPRRPAPTSDAHVATGLSRRRRLELLLEVVDYLVDDSRGSGAPVFSGAAGLTRDAGDELGAPAKEFYVADELLHETAVPRRPSIEKALIFRLFANPATRRFPRSESRRQGRRRGLELNAPVAAGRR